MLIGECPLWDPASDSLYWIDIINCRIHRFLPKKQLFSSWILPSEPGCICLHDSTSLIVAMRSGISVLNTADGSIIKLHSAPYDTNHIRFNDGRCDAHGRLWLGSLVDNRANQDARVYSFDKGKLLEFNTPVTVSNGIAFSPDFLFMYHSDTTAYQISRYNFDIAIGSFFSPNIFKTFPLSKNSDYLGKPDGAAVDSEGCYWVAMYEGACILRLSSDGDILDKIDLPLMCPTMISFGGDDLKTLFITSASHNRSQEEIKQFPLTGHVISTNVDVMGQREFAYID